MPNDRKIELSRRTILGGLGTIGVAAAGAGLGTTAYFSDQETYTNNSLTAGSLDLKVDWEEHYSDWSDDEANLDDDNPDNNLDVVMPAALDEDDNGTVSDSEAEGYVGLPDPENPLIYVAQDDLSAFMDNTSIEAYPDANDDAIQDDFRTDEGFAPCEQLADTPEDLNPMRDGALRTMNDDTVTGAQGERQPAPLINLTDVKPGDFGELTLSFHLCDNPGYVWMNGQLVDSGENSVMDPEGDDPDETDGKVELLDAVQTLLWYDEDGDNVYEPGGVEGAVDVALVADISGSMGGSANGGTKLDEAKNAGETLVDSLNSNDNAAGVTFSTEASRPFDLTAMDAAGRSGLKTAINNASAGGFTNIQGGVIYATEELLEQEDGYSGSGSGAFNAVTTSPSGPPPTRNTEQVMVVLSDGVANRYYDSNGNVQQDESVPASGDPSDNEATNAAVQAAQIAKDAGIRVFTIGFALDELSSDARALAQNTLMEMASPGDFYTDVQTGELVEVVAQIAQAIEGEECFWRGSLRQTLNLLDGQSADGTTRVNDGLGIPLDGNRETDYDEIVGDGSNEDGPPRPDDGVGEGRDCFVDSTTNDIGFAWWLPVDHGNEVQSDSIAFDLGFYTEQCRHNDGSGMEPVSGDPNNPEPANNSS